MRSIVQKVEKGSNAVVQKYSIFSRMVYDPETELDKLQYPNSWNTSPTFDDGFEYHQDTVLRNVSQDYKLFAQWPKVMVKLIYNYFDRPSEIERIVSGSTATLKGSNATGFQCWLDKNANEHLSGSELLVPANTQLYVSCCYDLSLSYNLNGGYLESGDKADTQAAQYSRWLSSDFKTYDTPATIVLDADSPKSNTGSFFDCWKVGSKKLSKGDSLQLTSNATAVASWLYNHNYAFIELCSFAGDSPSEEYGRIETIGEFYGDTLSSKTYRAAPAEGYKFHKFEVVKFNGYSNQPAQTLTSQEIEVALEKVEPAATSLNLSMTTIAYFSFDETWSVVYVDGSQVFKHARIVGNATKSQLQTSGNTRVTSVYLAPGVTGVGNGEIGIFRDCTNLVSMTWSGIEVVGVMAFMNTPKLRSIEFPASLKTICQEGFSKSGLEEVALRGSIEKIDSYAFSECPNLKKVQFEDLNNSLSVFNNAFGQCTSLTSFSVPSKCVYVGDNCFVYDTSLTTLSVEGSSLAAFTSNALNGSSIVTVWFLGMSSTDILG